MTVGRQEENRGEGESMNEGTPEAGEVGGRQGESL